MADGPGGANVVGKVSVRVVPNTSKFRRELYAQLKRLDDDLKVKVGVEVDDRFAKAQLSALRKQLRDTSGTAHIDVVVDQHGAEKHFADTLAKLKARAAGDSVKVNVDVDSQGLKRSAIAMDNMAQSASGLSRGFSGIGRTGALVGAVFAAAAPAVGLVSGLIAGLPSLMSAFAVGAGAVALGMDGIKKSAAPFKPMFDELKASVSSVFETRLPPIFTQLSSLLPTIRDGMGLVAGGLSDMFQGFTDVVTSSRGMTNIRAILDGVAGMFHDLQPIIGSFTSSFLELSAAGAKSFGLLLTPIRNFAQGWGEMVSRITSSGAFEGAMSGLSATLDGILNLFTRLVESGVTAMATLGPALQNGLGGLGDLLVAAMPALTSFSNGIANTIGALGTSLAPAFAALTPAIDAIMPTITQLAGILGQTLSTAVAALAPVLTQIAQVLGPVLTTAASALAPILTQVASTLGTVLLAAVQQLAPYMPALAMAFAQLAAALSGALAQFLPVLAQAFIDLLPSVIQLVPVLTSFIQVMTPLIPVIGQLATWMVQLAQAAMQVLFPMLGAGQAMSDMTTKVSTLASALSSGVIAAMQSFVSTIVSGFGQAVAAVTSGVSSIVSEVGQIGSKVVAACSNFGSLLVSAGADLIRCLINGIKSMVGAAVAAAQSVGSAVVGAVKGLLRIGSPSKVFHQIGSDTVTGFTNGIGSGKQSAANQATAMAQNVVDSARNVIATGIDPLMVDVQIDPEALKKLKEEKDLLDLQAKTLRVQKDQAPDKMAQTGLQAQLDQINARKREIALIQEQAAYQKKYGQEIQSTEADYSSQIASMANIPKDFASANINQFTKDMGMSGQGAIPDLINQGANYVFQVLDLESAISGMTRVQSKNALAQR